MRKILYLAVGLMVLLVIAMAQMDSCPDTIDVYPGEPIKLNGTSIPSTTSVVDTVYYAWTFDGTVYDYDNNPITEPATTPTVEFYANLTSDDCNKAYLSVTYERNVTGLDNETCVNMTCIEICTGGYSCPLCESMFCANASSQYDVCKASPMTFDGGDCPCKICFDNWTQGMIVNWSVDDIVLTDTACVDFTDDSANNESCVLIDWVNCSYTNKTHKVKLEVFRNESFSQDFFNCTGNVTLVEIPVAQISRE